jgi:hypothetical protein
MILQIERQWNRDPGWVSSLPRPTQIQLIADFRLDHEDPKRRESRSNSAKRARFDMIKERAIKQGSI